MHIDHVKYLGGDTMKEGVDDESYGTSIHDEHLQ